MIIGSVKMISWWKMEEEEDPEEEDPEEIEPEERKVEDNEREESSTGSNENP